MLNLESKYFNIYYGKNPDFYNIAFLHYNIEIFDDDLSELQKIERDLDKVKKYCKKLFKIYFSDINTLIRFIDNT